MFESSPVAVSKPRLLGRTFRMGGQLEPRAAGATHDRSRLEINTFGTVAVRMIRFHRYQNVVIRVAVALTGFGLWANAAHSQLPSEESLRFGTLCSRMVDARSESARREFEQLARKDGRYREFFLGCSLLAEGKVSDAVASLKQAQSEIPSDAVLLLWLGRAHGLEAQRAFVARQAIVARRAREAFDRAIIVAPDYLAAHEARMQFALQAPGFLGGGEDRARVAAAEISRRDSHRGRVANLAIARHARDHQRAAALLEKIVADFPDSTGYSIGLATELTALKIWARAWTVLDSAERRFPESPRVRLAIGVLADESRQQPNRGRAALNTYIQQLADSVPRQRATAHWRLGRLHEQSNQPDSARKAYAQSAALDPSLKAPRDALKRLGPL
jgi:tetratricopeptide (TPR) repeat protein